MSSRNPSKQKPNTRVVFLSYRSLEALNCCEFLRQRVPDGSELTSPPALRSVVRGQKATPTCEERNPLPTEDSARESCLRLTQPCASPATYRQGHGTEENRRCSVGSPCAHHTRASVTPAETALRLLPPQTHAGHTWPRNPSVSTARTLPVKAQPAQHPASAPHGAPARGAQLSSAFPVKPGQNPAPAGSGMLGQRGCRASGEHGPAHSHWAWVRRGARPCTDSPGIPARNANAGAAGKEGANERLRPTSEPRKVPHQPEPARHPAWRRGCCGRALLTGPGPWPFWL